MKKILRVLKKAIKNLLLHLVSLKMVSWQTKIFVYFDAQLCEWCNGESLVTEYSKGNKTIPEKVATTRIEDGQK